MANNQDVVLGGGLLLLIILAMAGGDGGGETTSELVIYDDPMDPQEPEFRYYPTPGGSRSRSRSRSGGEGFDKNRKEDTSIDLRGTVAPSPQRGGMNIGAIRDILGDLETEWENLKFKTQRVWGSITPTEVKNRQLNQGTITRLSDLLKSLDDWEDRCSKIVQRNSIDSSSVVGGNLVAALRTVTATSSKIYALLQTSHDTSRSNMVDEISEELASLQRVMKTARHLGCARNER